VNLILLGPPGAGKGTQAQFIVKKYNYFQLSSGDLLRDEIKKNTTLGKRIVKIMPQGELITDEIVNLLLKKVITKPENKNRIIFDGYPRNIFQAENLDQVLKEDNQVIGTVIFLNVSREIIKKRIIGRITCEKCNVILNEFFNQDEIDLHQCGKKYLKKRDDDNQQTIITRYNTYMEKTKPLLDFYSSKESFYEIDASLKIEVITGKIDKILNV
jgi:adenylate kinase